MKRVKSLFVLLTMLAGVPEMTTFAHAIESPSSTPVTVLSREITFDVHDDGSFAVDRTEVIRVNTAQGAKAISQINLSFNAARQSQEVLDASVRGPSGAEIAVPKTQIVVASEDKNGNAPQFDPVTTTTINFPGLMPGAEIRFRIRREQKQPFIAGQFSAIEMFSRQTHFRHVSVTVRAPKRMHLQAQAIGLAGGRSEDPSSERQVWSWTLGEHPALPAEPGSVSLMDTSPRVVITSFASYADVARAYSALSGPRVVVTPAIEQQADDITKDVTGHAAQARALYNWVATHIKHVPVYLEFGGLLPHAADAVLMARRGDSKDHNVLLAALLKAKGIQSSPALVNNASSYWMPEVAAVPGQFNHVLTFVPELSLYLDSSNELAAFGAFSNNLPGKPALIVEPLAGPAIIKKLPVAGPWADTVQVEQRMLVKPDGSIDGRAQVGSSGLFEEFARQTFSRVAQGAQSQIATNVLKLSGQEGKGNYQYEDASNIEKPFRFTTEFALPAQVKLPGPGTLRIPDGLGSLSNIASTFEALALEQRLLAFPMHGRRTVELIRIALPVDFKEMEVPTAVRLDSRFGHYESSYEVDDHRLLTVKRMLLIRSDDTLILPSDYPEFRRFGLAVLADLRTPIAFR
jgi:hypothetical protein